MIRRRPARDSRRRPANLWFEWSVVSSTYLPWLYGSVASDEPRRELFDRDRPDGPNRREPQNRGQ